MQLSRRPWHRIRMGMQSAHESRFVRNVIAVTTGVAAAQIISMIFTPLLTRIFGPEAFGALAAFNAVIRILTPAATLGYANAVVMADSEEEATEVARLSIVCASIVTALVIVITIIFYSPLAIWIGLSSTPEILFLIPVAIVSIAFLTIADQMAIRKGLFKAKAKAKVGSAFLMNIGKLLGGLSSPVAWVLILLENIGKVVNFFFLWRFASRQGTLQVSRWFGLQGAWKVAKKHRDFALFRMPQSVINAAAVGLPVILLTSYFGVEYAGQYSLTTLVLGAPMLLLGQSVGEVFYPKITATIKAKSSDAWRQLLSATLVLMAVSFITFGTVIIFGPELFAFILGDEWRRAGEYSQWVSIWLGLSLITRPAVAAFPILKLQSYLLSQEVISVLLRLGAFLAGIHYWQSDMVAVALFSLTGVFLMCVHLCVGFGKLRYEMRSWGVDPIPAQANS